MMKRTLVLFIAFVMVFNIVKADEGMWFLAFINKNYEHMKSKGFKLTPKDIYDINNSSLKDAVISLDRGSCTGEIISPNGLLLTNHHCGYDEIQSHSTVEHDYLTNGFWAMKKEQELPNPNKTVSFLVKVEDVSDKINALLNENMNEDERENMIQKTSEKIVKEATEGTKYEAQVNRFFNGNNFYLCVYLVYKDVRLVGAPPSSIGKFGGDTDNWMWYRHTGDFCMFRVYSAPDGSPAEYSPNNVPLNTKKFLKINIGGIKEGDFAMILGYPGTTERYLTSWGVKEKMENENSIHIKIWGEKLRLMKQDMDADPKVRIQYASKYSYFANFHKLAVGENKGIIDLNVIKRKQKIEQDLAKWIKKDKSKRVQKYGEALKLIEEAYTGRLGYDKVQNYWLECFYRGPEIMGLAAKFRGLYISLQQGDSASIKEKVEELKKEGKTFFKDFNPATEKKIFTALMKFYKSDITKEYYPAFFDEVDNQYGGDFAKFADFVYSNTIFADEAKYNEFLNKPHNNILNKDAGFAVTNQAIEVYFTFNEKMAGFGSKLEKGMRLFTAAWIQMENEKDKNKLYYPDANSTMRLTYGNIGGYKAGEKKYVYYTDLDGYMAKEDPKNDEFIVAPRLKELWKAKDYGRYGKDGKLYTCFISNNDITGGNSGSPVMNGNGELIGVAFDGNWEAMSGNIAFEPALQRTICVDIRFVLFVVEKFAGAKHLVDEMNLVN